MKIPTSRVLRDMEIAAELRAAGATWQTAALQIGRQLGVLHRWANHYRDEWQRFLKDADERLTREATNEWRGGMRALLRHENSKIRLTAADKLTNHRLEQKAAERPPELSSGTAAMIACMEQLTQADLEHWVAKFVRKNLANGTMSLEEFTATDASERPSGDDPTNSRRIST
jgi:hypothetical protein